MAQMFCVRDDFNFALMGKDTPKILSFISETIYQYDFLQKHLHSTTSHKAHEFIALVIISL